MTWEVVDIHAGIDEDQREFMPRWAIWNTVTSQFVQDDYGGMGWDDREDFMNDMRDTEMRRRGAQLIPGGRGD